MMEFFFTSIPPPYLPRRFEESERACNIGLNKRRRRKNGPVHMRLGGEMNDRVNLMFG